MLRVSLHMCCLLKKPNKLKHARKFTFPLPLTLHFNHFQPDEYFSSDLNIILYLIPFTIDMASEQLGSGDSAATNTGNSQTTQSKSSCGNVPQVTCTCPQRKVMKCIGILPSASIITSSLSDSDDSDASEADDLVSSVVHHLERGNNLADDRQ